MLPITDGTDTSMTRQVSYPDAFSLMEHLQKMGEGSASLRRQFHVGSDTFLSMASLYQGNASIN